MKYKIIGVKDALIKRFMPLQCVNDLPDEDIIESHRRAVLMGKIPQELAEQYVLYRFGTFDDETGEIQLERPVLLAALVDFVPKKEENKEVADNVIEKGSRSSEEA